MRDAEGFGNVAPRGGQLNNPPRVTFADAADFHVHSFAPASCLHLENLSSVLNGCPTFHAPRQVPQRRMNLSKIRFVTRDNYDRQFCEDVEFFDADNVEPAERDAVEHYDPDLAVVRGLNNHGGYVFSSVETVNLDLSAQHSVEPIAAAKDDTDNWGAALMRSERSIIDSQNADFPLNREELFHRQTFSPLAPTLE
jgi:hypothetical protein